MDMKPGIYNGITNAHYHSDKGSYSSSLVKMLDVPALAKHHMESPPEYKECFRIGSAIHKYILEREEFESEFLTGINCARRSKADRQSWADWYSAHGTDGDQIIENPAAQWNGLFEQQSGLSMVTPEEIQQIADMAESVASNENAIELLNKGESELSAYWQDEETGLNLRVRPDYLNNDFISDLKSIQSAREHKIVRSIIDRGYGISQAMYQDGIHKITGDWRPFLFIFVEKAPPYLCVVIALDEEAQTAVWERYRTYLRKLADCLDSDEWPGLPDNLQLQLPQWGL